MLSAPPAPHIAVHHWIVPIVYMYVHSGSGADIMHIISVLGFVLFKEFLYQVIDALMMHL